MSSLRRLNRRLLRWKRYAARYGYPPPKLAMLPPWGLPLAGHVRAFDAVKAEEERRWTRAVYGPTVPDTCYCNGCIGMGPCDDDLGRSDEDRCCLAGPDAHPGPCVIRCTGCNGNGACPECGGLDDLGCWHCDGSGGCPHHCDDGEIVLEEWATVPVRTVPVDRRLL